jgi:hypothetical protein
VDVSGGPRSFAKLFGHLLQLRAAQQLEDGSARAACCEVCFVMC